MSKGTINLTNQSGTITGVDTSFINDISAGDMVVSVVGGVTYTLPVKSIESEALLTLIKNYDGPTQSDVAWVAVPRDTLNQITAQLSAEAAKAIRGLNYDKSNWQLVFSELNDISITLPDGSTFNGPSWLKITNLLNDIDIAKLFEIANSVESNATVASSAATTATTQANSAKASAITATEKASEATGAATIATNKSEIATSQASVATEKAEEAARYAASYRFRIGEIITSAFRKEDLGMGWYLANGDKYALTSPQGQVLKSLPENYKSDWGIVEVGGFINLPNLFDSATGFGYFPRFVDGINRRVGNAQGDAIRNFTGTLWGISPGVYAKDLTPSGVFKTSITSSVLQGEKLIFEAKSNLHIDASLQVPTASENRPSNIGFTPAIYLGI